MAQKEKVEKFVNIKNKRASFEYHFLETFVAGMVLRGTEIKSIRQSKVQMQDAFCTFKGTELFVVNMHISTYTEGTYNNHQPKTDRKLLLKGKELKKLLDKSQDNGVTIIPVRMFINDRGFAKLEIALARGKKLYDKREDIKDRDIKREMQRVDY
ncbi:SsrA-binding protein [Flexibacter flexilis DSM 6793]|uniref:SsrA-binding protein n=1 Tax=Flexibacter flexilis DSM 6793 TaxID=927664 RepID=A0A1I1K575_9BACT|nr:SsrA-binding protein SmpB [Flexibacter flexilis]SFC55671.1 SsrA-binding protein [Flexibacter flexilis DSM 6793]